MNREGTSRMTMDVPWTRMCAKTSQVSNFLCHWFLSIFPFLVLLIYAFYHLFKIEYLLSTHWPFHKHKQCTCITYTPTFSSPGPQLFLPGSFSWFASSGDFPYAITGCQQLLPALCSLIPQVPCAFTDLLFRGLSIAFKISSLSQGLFRSILLFFKS